MSGYVKLYFQKKAFSGMGMGNSWKGLNIYTINFLSNCLSFDSPKHYRPYQQDVVRHDFTADLKNIKTSQNLYIYIYICTYYAATSGDIRLLKVYDRTNTVSLG